MIPFLKLALIIGHFMLKCDEEKKREALIKRFPPFVTTLTDWNERNTLVDR